MTVEAQLTGVTPRNVRQQAVVRARDAAVLFHKRPYASEFGVNRGWALGDGSPVYSAYHPQLPTVFSTNGDHVHARLRLERPKHVDAGLKRRYAALISRLITSRFPPEDYQPAFAGKGKDEIEVAIEFGG